MVAHRFVAVVGARVVPAAWAPQVAAVVRCFLERGGGVGSGGAPGGGPAALGPGPALGPCAARGGRVVPGAGAGRAALLARSGRLARASSGVVAFLWGPSRGSVFTVREAIRAGKPAAVVLVGGGAELPGG